MQIPSSEDAFILFEDRDSGVTDPFLLSVADGQDTGVLCRGCNDILLVDGVDRSDFTRDQMHTLLADGSIHHLEFREVEISRFNQLRVASYGTGSRDFNLTQGTVFGIALDDQPVLDAQLSDSVPLTPEQQQRLDQDPIFNQQGDGPGAELPGDGGDGGLVEDVCLWFREENGDFGQFLGRVEIISSNPPTATGTLVVQSGIGDADGNDPIFSITTDGVTLGNHNLQAAPGGFVLPSQATSIPISWNPDNERARIVLKLVENNSAVVYRWCVDPGDVDGDGVPNDQDPDIDGDGVPNDQDPDIDGDGLPNGDDDMPGGTPPGDDGGSDGGGSDGGGSDGGGSDGGGSTDPPTDPPSDEPTDTDTESPTIPPLNLPSNGVEVFDTTEIEACLQSLRSTVESRFRVPVLTLGAPGSPRRFQVDLSGITTLGFVDVPYLPEHLESGPLMEAVQFLVNSFRWFVNFGVALFLAVRSFELLKDVV